MIHASASVQAPLRPDHKERYIFCDESGLDDRFFVLGSLTGSSNPEDVKAMLDSVKEEHVLKSEIKWERLPSSPGKFFNGYKAVVAKFMDLDVTYKALIVDTKYYPLNHPKFTDRDKSIGYFQFYLVLLFTGIIKYEPLQNTRIYLHTPAYKLQGGLTVLESEINEAATAAGFPDMDGKSCCRISAHSSQKNSLLQLTDILTGMISAIWNEKVLRSTKQELIEECCARLKQDITTPSASRHVDIKFNRWLFRPNEEQSNTKRWPALCPPTE